MGYCSICGEQDNDFVKAVTIEGKTVCPQCYLKLSMSEMMASKLSENLGNFFPFTLSEGDVIITS